MAQINGPIILQLKYYQGDSGNFILIRNTIIHQKTLFLIFFLLCVCIFHGLRSPTIISGLFCMCLNCCYFFSYHKLSKLKSDLNDALYSDKWTPDAYLLAKSYVAEEIPPQTRQETLLSGIP